MFPSPLYRTHIHFIFIKNVKFIKINEKLQLFPVTFLYLIRKSPKKGVLELSINELKARAEKFTAFPNKILIVNYYVVLIKISTKNIPPELFFSLMSEIKRVYNDTEVS